MSLCLLSVFLLCVHACTAWARYIVSKAGPINNVISFVAASNRTQHSIRAVLHAHCIYTVILLIKKFDAVVFHPPTNTTPWHQSPALYQCAGFYPLCCLPKVYRGLHPFSIRQFKQGGGLLLDALSAFVAVRQGCVI